MINLSDEDIILIITLSDCKGYSKKELHESEIPDVAYNTRSKILDCLEYGFEEEVEFLDEPPFINWFSFGDIKEPYNLATKFLAGKDPLSRSIREWLNGETKKFLDECDDKTKLRYKLLYILNLLMESAFLYEEPHLISDVKLSEETRKMMEEKPTGMRSYLLNRLLLEDAYPNEIAKRRKSIIYMGMPRKSAPKGSEEPYFLNENPSVFKLIISVFNKKKEAIRDKKDNLIFDYNEDYKRLQFSKNSNSEKMRRLTEDFEKNKISLEKIANQNDERYKEFLRSEYTSRLIKEFGILPILDIMRSLAVEQAKLLYTIEISHKKELIADEEFEKIRGDILKRSGGMREIERL
jgi:hypothetical protein